jgi:hypothetical protein
MEKHIINTDSKNYDSDGSAMIYFQADTIQLANGDLKKESLPNGGLFLCANFEQTSYLYDGTKSHCTHLVIGNHP